VKLCGNQTGILAHTYKRLFFDGVCTGNLSVGLVRYKPLPAKDIVDFLSLPVRVGKMSDTVPLASIGQLLADFLFRATTQHLTGSPENRLLVCAGEPVMICELACRDDDDAILSERRYSRMLNWHVLDMFHRRELVRGVGTTIWISVRKTAAASRESEYGVRNLFCKRVRALILRRHCARNALNAVMRAIGQRIVRADDTRGTDALERYLLATFARLSERPDERWAAEALRTPGAGQLERLSNREIGQIALAIVLAAESAASIDDAEMLTNAISVMTEQRFHAPLLVRAQEYLEQSSILSKVLPSTQTPERRLHGLLVAMFDAQQLELLVSLDFPDIRGSMPASGVSATVLAQAVIQAIQQRDGGFDALFDAMLHIRPGRAAEIATVRALFPARY
jgi:hypothetical protein